jgi:ribose transport system permease protein
MPTPELRTIGIRAWAGRPGRSASTGGVPGIAFLVTAVGLVTAAFHHRFLSSNNLAALAYEVGTTSTIAMGQMIVLGIGAMDLSLGGIGGLVGIVVGWGLVVEHWPVPLAIAVAVAFGTGCGALNGWLVNRLHFSGATAFVVTLASGTFYTGVTLGITKAIPYYDLPGPFDALSGNAFAGIPWVFVVMIAIAAMVASVFAWTSYGLRNLAVGGGATVARLCGTRVSRVVLVCFALAGCFASIGALFYTAQFGAAQPTLGTDWLLPSFAAPILGGTSLSGGRVSVLGTILGALFLAEVTDVLVFLDVSAFWNTFVQGATILFAVGLDAGRRRAFVQLVRAPVGT